MKWGFLGILAAANFLAIMAVNDLGKTFPAYTINGEFVASVFLFSFAFMVIGYVCGKVDSP